MVSLVTVCSINCFLEIKRYQTIIVLKGATYVVFVFKSLLHWCFYVLVLYSKPVPVWLSVWFLPTEQVSFVSIRAPAIRYAYRLHSRYDFSIFRLIVTPLVMVQLIVSYLWVQIMVSYWAGRCKAIPWISDDLIHCKYIYHKVWTQMGYTIKSLI